MDDASQVPGAGAYSLNATPWPTTLYVKVTRTDGQPAPDCTATYEYDLTISR